MVTNIKESKPDLNQLKAMLQSVEKSDERNQKILQAHNDGYSQHAIAECLGFTQPYKEDEEREVIVITSYYTDA